MSHKYLTCGIIPRGEVQMKTPKNDYQKNIQAYLFHLPFPLPSYLRSYHLLSLYILFPRAAFDSDPDTIKISDSNLQTFPPSETQGKISSVFCALQDADGTNPDLLLIFIGIFEGSNVAMVVVDTFSRLGKGAKMSFDESSQGIGWFSMFSVAAYKPYFDVDMPNVLERTKDSLFPFRRSFNEKTTNNPDLSLSFPIISIFCCLPGVRLWYYA